MNRQDARRILSEAIGQVAPEVDTASIDRSAPLAEVADLDSIDLFTLMGLLADAIGADIPQDDYPQLESLESATEYLAGRLP